ncbi:MAG: PPOX class F420-dependent oxidoreductase [Firmicutes bacterium]|nr:PPOX class F420-dependent oxidoreductase [Bacillota bacterium]
MAHFSEATVSFLEHPFLAGLTTLNPDGSPQFTYVWFELDPQKEQLLISTTTDRVKYRNVCRDPRVSVGLVHPQNPWQWVILSGRVQVDEEPSSAHALIERLALKYRGPEDGAAYAQQTKTEPRVILRVTPTRVRTMGL